MGPPHPRADVIPAMRTGMADQAIPDKYNLLSRDCQRVWTVSWLTTDASLTTLTPPLASWMGLCVLLLLGLLFCPDWLWLCLLVRVCIGAELVGLVGVLEESLPRVLGLVHRVELALNRSEVQQMSEVN